MTFYVTYRPDTLINIFGPNTQLVQNNCFIGLTLAVKRRYVTYHMTRKILQKPLKKFKKNLVFL